MHFNKYFCYRQDLEKRGKEIEAVELEKQAETARCDSENEKKRAYSIMADLLAHKLEEAKKNSKPFIHLYVQLIRNRS